jgi:hypothetical protein
MMAFIDKHGMAAAAFALIAVVVAIHLTLQGIFRLLFS